MRIDVIPPLRDEFTAIPGLRLTEPQVERLCTPDASTSASALHASVSSGFLRRMPDGSYGRIELVTNAPSDPPLGGRARIMPSPWRRILCVVDLNKDSANGLSTAARSALRYATTLAVTHQARITALHVISDRASESALMSVGDEPCRSVFGEPFPGLIDVHVAIGSRTKRSREWRRTLTPI
jgi:hypothetical protein